MQFKSNYRLKGSLGRLIASVSLFTLVFSMVGIVGSAPVSAEEAPERVDAQGASDVSTLSGVRITGALDQVRFLSGNQRLGVAGWACTPDAPRSVLRVDVYNMGVSGGRFTREAFLGSLTANRNRQDSRAIAGNCGGFGNRGFNGDVRGVCVGRGGRTTVDIRAWAVFTDRGDARELPGFRSRFTVNC